MKYNEVEETPNLINRIIFFQQKKKVLRIIFLILIRLFAIFFFNLKLIKIFMYIKKKMMFSKTIPNYISKTIYKQKEKVCDERTRM